MREFVEPTLVVGFDADSAERNTGKASLQLGTVEVQK